MKLYEFIFNDNTNMTESEILESLNLGLENEALVQGWAPGYKIQQCQKPKQLGNGEVEYYFEVLGEHVGGQTSGEENKLSVMQMGDNGNAAASR